jgi:hypothetical protein
VEYIESLRRALEEKEEELAKRLEAKER